MITRHRKPLGGRRHPSGSIGFSSAIGALFLLILLVVAGRPALVHASQDPGESSSSKRHSDPPPAEVVNSDPDGKIAAQKDIDVGVFYMHKGDSDAAIGRYQDAAQVAPKFGKPRLMLAEAFEKKGDKSTAVKYYKQYLEVEPTAPDKQKIEKRIEKLSAR